MLQRQRDLAAGLNTAAFVTGYRGSPLGGVDQQMTYARRFLEKHHIRFQPGVNEDLAATAIWGSQQLDLFRSEEHTSELQSLMRNSYAVFCLKKKKEPHRQPTQQEDYHNKPHQR